MPELNLAQAIGLLSFFIGATAFLQKNDVKFKALLCLLFCSQTLHFYLLGAHTAAAASLISLIRTLAALRFTISYIGYFFIAVNIFWGVYLYSGFTSVLAITGTVLGTYAMFFLSGISMRLTLLVGTLCWLSHNFLVKSIGGTMLEAMILVTNVVTIYRLHRDHKKLHNEYSG